MSEFLFALGQIAPIYNMALVLVVFYLFLKLFKEYSKGDSFLVPWKLIFTAVLIFVIEETLTLLRIFDIINIPIHINGFFELFMIITFIYALLIMKDHIKTKHL